MMKRKTWALLSLALLLGTIGAICLTVIVIDPFQVYHLATRYMPPIDNTTQVYANAGIARSYDYDSAVVGTSVTENFRPTQMDALLGGRFIKLCTSAGTAYNHALLMDLAFRTHDVKRIVYGLDVYSFIAKVDQTGSDVPMYLYDDKELERYRKSHTGDFRLQRYKGLGEMDPEQLWETTLDPERRVLKRVEIEDARMASEVTEMLMGSEVPPRKQFIYDHANEAEIDA